MERICVCGLGKVGRPLLGMLRSKGFQVVGYDSIPKLSECSLSQAVDRSDVAMFIVPTPSKPDGSFSNEFLWEALSRFSGAIPMDGKRERYLYIIVSTTTPGSCEEFKREFGPNVVYKPELIRLEYVHLDLLNPSHVLIGADSQEAGDRVDKIHQHISDAPIFRMSLLEAELAKITLNCALTMKISLANQLHLVARKLNADSHKIMEFVGADPRIGNLYLKPGAPYGGPCLPRDNRMFQYVASKVGIYAALSTGADIVNDAITEATTGNLPVLDREGSTRHGSFFKR